MCLRGGVGEAFAEGWLTPGRLAPARGEGGLHPTSPCHPSSPASGPSRPTSAANADADRS